MVYTPIGNSGCCCISSPVRIVLTSLAISPRRPLSFLLNLLLTFV